MVFPGGDFDATRPTLQQNLIDFNGRTGYVRTAIEAGVPIVPIVSIGGQETQFFLTRGDWLAKKLGVKIMRSALIPISAGFPFGVSVGGMNLPLPSKIVTQVLPAIDIAKRFGGNPMSPKWTRMSARLCRRLWTVLPAAPLPGDRVTVSRPRWRAAVPNRRA